MPQDEEAVLWELAHVAGPDTVQALQQLVVQEETAPASTVQEARKRQASVLKTAASKLSSTQFTQLQQGVRSRVDTQFGKRHEDHALDWFQQHVQCEIHHRNEQLMEWPFTKKTTTTGTTVVEPMAPAQVKKQHLREPAQNQFTSIHTKSDSQQKKRQADDLAEPVVIDLTVDEESTGNHTNGENRHGGPTSQQEQASHETNKDKNEADSDTRPFFYVVGSVDGLRDQWIRVPTALQQSTKNKDKASSSCQEPISLHTNLHDKNTGDLYFEDDDEEWQVQTNIVEVKHRMSRLHKVAPPLYEQIQAVVYCLMYNVTQADLVQVLRVPKHKSTPNKNPQKENRLSPQKRSVSAKSQSPSKTNTTNTRGGSPKTQSVRNENTSTLEGWIQRSERPNSTPIEHDKLPKMNDTTNNKDDNNKDSVELQCCVHYISLDDPILAHKQQWTTRILPRLQSMVELVYRIRQDDGRRYQLLLTIAEATASQSYGDAWTLIMEECPWLHECDDALHAYRNSTDDRPITGQPQP